MSGGSVIFFVNLEGSPLPECINKSCRSSLWRSPQVIFGEKGRGDVLFNKFTPKHQVTFGERRKEEFFSFKFVTLLPHPPPPPPSECASPLGPKWGEDQHSLGCEGVGVPNLDDWNESLALGILCDKGYPFSFTPPDLQLVQKGRGLLLNHLYFIF